MCYPLLSTREAPLQSICSFPPFHSFFTKSSFSPPCAFQFNSISYRIRSRRFCCHHRGVWKHFWHIWEIKRSNFIVLWHTDVPLQKNQIAILNTIAIPETSNYSKKIISSIFDCMNRCIFNLFTLPALHGSFRNWEFNYTVMSLEWGEEDECGNMTSCLVESAEGSSRVKVNTERTDESLGQDLSALQSPPGAMVASTAGEDQYFPCYSFTVKPSYKMRKK